MDASKEVRSLLEFLFLDVKVRSPSEVSQQLKQLTPLYAYLLDYITYLSVALNLNLSTDLRLNGCETCAREGRSCNCVDCIVD